MRSSSAMRTPIIPVARCRSCARFRRASDLVLPADHPIVTHAARTSVASRCFAGTQWQWDRVTFTLLYPDAITPTPYARATILVRAADRVGRRTSCSPATSGAQRSGVAAAGTAMEPSDVLVAPHHARASSTSAFIAGVSPRVAVFAAGYRNRFGHPRAMYSHAICVQVSLGCAPTCKARSPWCSNPAGPSSPSSSASLTTATGTTCRSIEAAEPPGKEA